jgi:hypothetical protein
LKKHILVKSFFFFFLVVLGFWTQASCLLGKQLQPLCQPYFRYFWYRVLWTVSPGWLRTVIFLTSASWLARITGMNHWSLADKVLEAEYTHEISTQINSVQLDWTELNSLSLFTFPTTCKVMIIFTLSIIDYFCLFCTFYNRIVWPVLLFLVFLILQVCDIQLHCFM